MKIFENKKIEIKDGDKELGYANLALTCLNNLPNGGISPVEMAERIIVIDQLKDLKIDSSIELEDAHFKTLKTCADKTKWSAIHKDIIAFDEYLKEIQSKK